MVNKLKPDQGSRDDASQDRRIARRDRRRRQSREEILDAAERVLTRDGVTALTVDSVAQEVALTKAALYYYFSSKDQLLFETVFRHLVAEAEAIRDAVARAENGAEALRALVRTPIEFYRDKLDTFRLIYMHNQVAANQTPKPSPEMLERIRPLNGWLYGRAQELLERDREDGILPSEANPRRLAFVAHMAAIGILTMKGMVEADGDPLVHSDEHLIRELERSFTKAAGR